MSPSLGLSSPIRLGAIQLRNRNIMAALTRNRWDPAASPTGTGYPLHMLTKYYAQRARGGAGMIISEGALIAPQASEWPHAPGIWSREQVDGWKTIIDAVHKEGAAFVMQIWHVGRIAHPDMPNPTGKPVPIPAPSAIAPRGKKFFFPGVGLQERTVNPDEIKNPWELIDQYRIAAQNAKAAGADGVELHSSGGYLIHQFIDSGSNLRADEWGGSIEKRCKFGLEALKVLIDVWGADRVGVKISPMGGSNDVGMPVQETIETFTYYINEINKLGAAYIQLMRYFPEIDVVIDGKLRCTQHDEVAIYKPLMKPSKFVLNGNLTPTEADTLIKAGKIDAATFGRSWITQPDFQAMWEAGVPTSQHIDFDYLYGSPSGNLHEGYTDQPFAVSKPWEEPVDGPEHVGGQERVEGEERADHPL